MLKISKDPVYHKTDGQSVGRRWTVGRSAEDRGLGRMRMRAACGVASTKVSSRDLCYTSENEDSGLGTDT